MRPIILLSTYALRNAEQWDLCRMMERARVSEFDFIALEDRKGNVQELTDELDMYKEEPLVVTLDDTALRFAYNYLENHCKILDWYRPSSSYIPPKVVGQQLADMILQSETQED